MGKRWSTVIPSPRVESSFSIACKESEKVSLEATAETFESCREKDRGSRLPSGKGKRPLGSLVERDGTTLDTT